MLLLILSHFQLASWQACLIQPLTSQATSYTNSTLKSILFYGNFNAN